MTTPKALHHRMSVLWCRITMRHRGRVGFILDSGPFWMCDHCGQVLR